MADTPAEITPSALETPAPAPAVAASSEATRKLGLFSRLMGNESRITELDGRLNSELAAHAATREELAIAHRRIAEFDALEAQLEAQAAAAEAAAHQAQADAAVQVSAQVAAVVESLGVPEAALPALADATEEGPISLAEFNARTPAERMNYIRNGGKLSD